MLGKECRISVFQGHVYGCVRLYPALHQVKGMKCGKKRRQAEKGPSQTDDVALTSYLIPRVSTVRKEEEEKKKKLKTPEGGAV